MYSLVSSESVDVRQLWPKAVDFQDKDHPIGGHGHPYLGQEVGGNARTSNPLQQKEMTTRFLPPPIYMHETSWFINFLMFHNFGIPIDGISYWS